MIKLNFQAFFERSSNGDLDKLLVKIPKGHKELLNGFKFKYTHKNTLNGDAKHIGVIHKDKIEVAAPWNYGREFTTLHEIAHLVWAHKMNAKLKKEWCKLAKKTKEKPKDNCEELFAMAYAQTYAKNKLKKYDFESWQEFIRTKVPI